MTHKQQTGRWSLKLPTINELREALHSFNKREGVIFGLLGIVLAISAMWLLAAINTHISQKVPVHGGTITEGVIGTPRFVNPILALSDADRDLTSLIYSGLMRETSDSSLVPDLASEYTLSEDQTTYTFHIRGKAQFHDGEPVTADDVIFTIERIKNPSTKSPAQVVWSNATVEKIDEKTVSISLENPSPAFLESMTLGILPEHLWEEIPADQMNYSELNIEAVGSGPFRVKKVTQRKNSLIESYVLESFKQFTLGEPYIDELIIEFFPNKEELYSAYKSGAIDQMAAVDPEVAYVLKREGNTVATAPLPRIFGLFFNQNENPVFADQSAVSAIRHAIDKQAIVNQVLYGFGENIASPIPKTIVATQPYDTSREDGEARAILEDGDWELTEDNQWQKDIGDTTETLSFAISTGDAPELRRAAFAIKEQLAELHIPVEVSVYEVGNLNQNIIRPREYGALLFGQIVSEETDLYAFWHSSQRNDPGLNIAMFASAQADRILEEARTAMDQQERNDLYREFDTIVRENASAIFLYSPSFIYALDEDIHGVTLEHLESATDRFNTVYDWYTQTDYLWNFLSAQRT